MKKTVKRTAGAKSRTKSTAGKKTAKTISASAGATGIKKQYLKSNKVCKVTFRLPGQAAPEASVVTVVGDFNNWNLSETQMKRLKNGDFTATVALPCNQEYKFRYLIDQSRWENDWYADKYIPNEYGGDDSVVVTTGNGA